MHELGIASSILEALALEIEPAAGDELELSYLEVEDS